MRNKFIMYISSFFIMQRMFHIEKSTGYMGSRHRGLSLVDKLCENLYEKKWLFVGSQRRGLSLIDKLYVKEEACSAR